MQTKKMFLLIMIIPVSIILLIIAYLSLPWILIELGLRLEPGPPRPKITYGEFPFRLVYEINSERKVIEDTLICKYDGMGINLGKGKHRKWKKGLESGKEKIILLKVNDNKEIYYNPGSASYYMGDYDNPGKHRHNFPNAWYIEQDGDITRRGKVDEQELLNKYNIKLISWDYTEPIKNQFGSSK
ncbi:MAG: hypothetical protein ACOCQW_04170 [Halanaerobiaceae bacterium]